MKSLGILITYFNEKEMLTECLNSIFCQSVLPDEVWIYDDASSAPAKNYIPKEWPIRIMRSEINKGLGYARNALMAISKSDYIHFHDADDQFSSDWCRKIRSAINADEAEIIITEVSSFRDGKIMEKEVLGLRKILTVKDFVSFAINGIILAPSVTVKRQTALRIGGFRSRGVIEYSEDFDFAVRLAATGAAYKMIFEPLVIQNLRYDSMSHINRKGCLIDMVKLINLLSSELSYKYKNDLAEAAMRCGHTLFNIGSYEDAKKAFCLGKKLGIAKYQYQRLPYRILARAFGPEIAEYMGLGYRKIVPHKLRHLLIKTGF